MAVDFSPMVFDTWGGGLHGAGKEVVKAVSARCPGARPAAVGALRKGLSLQLGRSVARQLEALMMVSTETPACGPPLFHPAPPLRRRVTRSAESRAGGIPPLTHCGQASPITSPHARTTYLSVTRTKLFPRTNVTYLAMPTGPGRRAALRAGPPVCWPVCGSRPKSIWPSLR